ncbi:ABC transporter permease subunit [Streptomyces sp. SP17BM10]|uniref:ABC transporter permease subunit n=1 Tax=Streptomyces sp. SP17BM10 TaxID=3002530 RepID=UPI002E785334|nr:ABC transporter permease subunit [Streptomyces sp. SP17BM10]MEE1786713.1 ABC transporter permease subunit [Streptomyces sp. SP17BM10]
MSTGFPLFRLALHRRRRMLALLAAGMVLFETLMVAVVRAVPPEQWFAGAGRAVPDTLRAFSGSTGDVSIASHAGLLGAGLVHPFWIAMQLTAIGSLAAAAVAADVESGTIELLMVRPVSRARLLAERAAAVLASSLLLNAAATLTLVAGVALSPALHRAVPLGGILAAGLQGCAFTLCLAGPALAVSAAARRRAPVIGATIALGAVGFALNFVAMAWQPAAPLRYLSPFHYYTPGDALAHGTLEWGPLGVLTAVGIAGACTALPLLRRRDLAP